MDSSIHTGTPLRQRMIDDMRKLEQRTQEGYIRTVRRLAGRLLETLARHRQRGGSAAVPAALGRSRHLADQLNATLTGLKFFFDFT